MPEEGRIDTASRCHFGAVAPSIMLLFNESESGSWRPSATATTGLPFGFDHCSMQCSDGNKLRASVHEGSVLLSPWTDDIILIRANIRSGTGWL
jgi:hypothetical protein